MAYAFNPERLPDSRFLTGHLKYLVPGNEGRCLDPRRTPLRILLIEDNVDAAESARMLLRHEGHEVEVAHDAMTGLDKARGLIAALEDQG